MIRLEHGDMLEVIPRLVAEGVVVDSIVTDPPYHLTSTLARFGMARAARYAEGWLGARLLRWIRYNRYRRPGHGPQRNLGRERSRIYFRYS